MFDLRPNYGGGNEESGDLLQKVPGMYCYTQCPQPCSRLPPTHASTEDSWMLTGKSRSVSCGVTAPFSLVLVHKVLFVPSKSLFPQSCVSSAIKSHCLPKSNSLGVLSPFARSPGWEICCESENFLDSARIYLLKIILQFVDRLLSGSVVGLMVTSSKRAYSTGCVTQVAAP